MKKIVFFFCLLVHVYYVYADGTLDPEFGGGDGYITMPAGFYACGIAVQYDTNIIVAGSNVSNNFQVMRYLNDGTLDSTFNTNNSDNIGGIGTQGPAGIPFSVIAQPDGSIIVVGQDATGSNFQIAKYTYYGFLDTTFGTNGVTVGPKGFAIDSTLAINTANVSNIFNGNIVVAGNNDAGNGLIAQYNSSGVFSNTFAINSYGFGENVMVQSDSKVVMAGTNANGEMQITRYYGDGSVDRAFATNGIATGPSGVAAALLIQPDGKYVIAGYNLEATPQMLLARFTAEGTLDASFGTGGFVTGPANFFANSLALQADGKIIIGGDGSSTIKLTRYTATGILDTSFGSGGLVTGTIGNVFGIALQQNGYILTVGMDPIASNFQVARYTNSVPLTPPIFTSPLTNAVGQFTIEGVAQNPSQVYLYIDGSQVDSVYTDAGGANTWAVPTTLSHAGLYTLRAVALYKNGNSSSAVMDELRMYGK